MLLIVFIGTSLVLGSFIIGSLIGTIIYHISEDG